VPWADASHPLLQYVYATFNDTDYAANPTCCYGEGGRQAAANPNRTRSTGAMSGLWVDDAAAPRLAVCAMTMPELQHALYGAPQTAFLTLRVGDDASVSLDFQVFNVTATRLGGAHFLHSAPLLPAGGDYAWRMDKIGSWIDPLDTVTNGGVHQHGVRDGVRDCVDGEDEEPGAAALSGGD
jgi:hypothetical protein